MLADRQYAYKEPDAKAYKCKYCCHCHRRNHIYGKDIWLGVLLIVLLAVKAFLSI